jgi:Cu(I)/Ag(I) efflux system membrane protein CusA/SilA
MLIYLDHAAAQSRKRIEAHGRTYTRKDLYDAIMIGAAERVRPKMMAVVPIIAGLLPMMWSTGPSPKPLTCNASSGRHTRPIDADQRQT